MVDGSRYDLGRLGAEVAYTAAAKTFGPANVVMTEPSLGGRDLYTRDGKVVIQARMIAHYLIPTREYIYRTIRRQLESLVRKLNQDFQFRPIAEKGIAVLTIRELDGTWKLLMIAVRRCDIAEKSSPGRIRTSVTRSLLSFVARSRAWYSRST